MMLKWTIRVLAGLLALLLVMSAGFVVAYHFWLPGHERALRTGSQIATTSRGDVEYAVTGQGVPVLRIHGSPGGYDPSVAGARARPEDIAGFQIVAPSRPGYLRTPLSSGRTPAEQADLYAALLDELKIDRVIVSGVSGGGPSALQFAVRHPDRTIGLILVAPDLQSRSEYTGPLKSQSRLGMWMQDVAMWSGMTLMDTPLASIAMPRLMPGFDARDPLQMAMMREIGAGFVPSRLRSEGRANDIAQYRDLGIEALPLEDVSVPTLILHGTADENAPYSGSASIAKRLPRARLLTFEGGSHYVILTRAAEIRQRTTEFMQELLHDHAQPQGMRTKVPAEQRAAGDAESRAPERRR
jgi:pimeloyl-ACP methyl ester carboxylesterase